MSSGKLLESLIEQIERLLLPENFAVIVNEQVYNDDGIQIAEFDIEIEGKVGSTNLRWLIECRDRPSEGAAPGSWIEQLVGRRDRFNFSKVIAVSTTGFSEGAIEYAEESGIEIRTVKERELEDISHWFMAETMTFFKRSGRLEGAKLYVGPEDSIESKEALKAIASQHSLNEPMLISTETGDVLSVVEAFQAVVEAVGSFYEPIDHVGGSRKVRLRVSYPAEDSHFVVDTHIGSVRIDRILFVGELTVTKEEVPVSSIRTYKSMSGNEEIATTASFVVNVDGESLEVSFHNIAASGETRVLIRGPKKKGQQGRCSRRR